MLRQVDISNKKYTYDTDWNGQVLSGNIIALDTETTVVDEPEIPQLALISVSNGVEHFLIRPERLAAFILSHPNHHYVFFNIAFDFWVMDEYFSNNTPAKQALWNLVDKCHDAMLLDALLRLAKTDEYPSPQNLGIVAKRYARLSIDKEDPYRMRYGEIIGKDWDKVDIGFFDYAIKDTIATYFTFINLYSEAKEFALSAGVSPSTLKKYGPLTEDIQVKGALSLSRISHNGMNLNVEYSNKIYADFKKIVDDTVEKLKEYDEQTAEDIPLFQRHKKTGELLYTKNNIPRISLKKLRSIFTHIAQDLAIEKPPKTKKGSVCTSMKEWDDYRDKHPFLTLYGNLVEYSKLCQFFEKLRVKKIHPRFTYFVRTGRTSQQTPNIQQLPKGKMRQIIIAPKGYFLLAIDYAYIELRTLAHVCEDLFNKSVLADVIREGKDPHCHTASMFMGISYEAFLELKKTNPEIYKTWRQNAKPVNFGVPGGLGAKHLQEYAHCQYGVDFTLEEAQTFRNKLIKEVYPELDSYLSEDGMYILACNLGCSVEDAWQKFDWTGERHFGTVISIKNIVAGKPFKKDGTSYSENFCDKVWSNINALNQNPTLFGRLKGRVGNLDLLKDLFWGQVRLPTGRIRGRVSFTQAKNSPFQGLAADGAKLALWECVKKGYKVIGFIHDEIIFEIPDCGGYAAKKTVDEILGIMCDKMQTVTGKVPIAGDYLVSRSWRKDGKMRIEGNKIYPED